MISEPVTLPHPAAGLVAGPDGDLWVTHNENPGTVARVSTKGKIKPYTGGGTDGFTKNRRPAEIAVGADGAVWFIEETGYVGRVTSTGVVSEFGPLSGEPTAVTSGPDGNVWVAERNASIGDTVQGAAAQIAPDGTITEFALGTVDPSFITSGPDGALWFTEPDAVGRVTTTGEVSSFPTGIGPRGISSGLGDGLWVLGMSNVASVDLAATITPQGAISDGGAIAPGPDGALWFTMKDAVGRITPDGAVSSFSAGLTPGDAGAAVATGSDGAVWFAHDRPLLARITVPPLVDAASVSDVTRRSVKVTAAVHANALPAKATVRVVDPAGTVVAEKQVGMGPGPERNDITFSIPGLEPGTAYTVSVSAGSDAGDAYVPATTTFETDPPPPPKAVGGKSVVVQPSRGQVRIRLKGQDKWSPLEAADGVPVGTLVDTTLGAIRLESAMGDGTQSGVFYGGKFRVRQGPDGTTKLVLAGRLSCGKDGLASTSRKRKGKRKLWGSDDGGRFETHGRDSVATVRGTRWLTVDTCRGTLTRVVDGAVSVRARGKNSKTVLVEAGERHFVAHR